MVNDGFYFKREYEDLATGQLVLQDMVERLGIPVFSNIRSALDCTAKVFFLNLFRNVSRLPNGETTRKLSFQLDITRADQRPRAWSH